MWFDIKKTDRTTSQPYWWVAVGDNHEILCQSEMLSSKADCIKTIRSLIAGAGSAGVYDETGEAPGTDLGSKRIAL